MKSASPLVYLGIGAAIATGALFLMSQSVPPPSPNYSGAYPARKNVVNIFEYPTNSLHLAPGQEFVVYTVPSDRWLTVTDCKVYAYPDLRWGENNGGLFTGRGAAGGGGGTTNPWQSPVGSQVGWVFAPGSQLVLRYAPNPNTNPPPQPASLYWYYVTGYLSRE